ncbi:hypothetical protein QTP70_003437 [Hemibagrus guttatus]|uniref:Uncharacterized protein n=1 Tax=Hemibagrus guttatus TaxID=175788 RepID=A0AAE0UX82_9TELE|nr:hypothetical protein QTP70_003437 [Hemibagrus guttatus]
MSWTDTATVLLRKAGEMGLDKHLFLMNLRETGLANLTPFYRSVLEAWRILSFSRMPGATAGAWLLEKPLFNNHLLKPRVLCSASLCSRLRTSGYMKLGHIVSTGWAAVRERTRIRSQRLLDQLAAETVGSLPAAYQELLNDPTVTANFPSLNISAAVEEWQKDERLILSFTTLELGTFELAGKKALYMLCVKVWHAQALAGVPASRWTEYFGNRSSPKGSWRSLYKRPIDKWTVTTPSSKGLTVTTSPLLGLTVNMPLSLVPNSDHVLFPETGSDHAPSTGPSCDHIPFTGPYSDHALFHGTDSDHTPFTGTDSDHALFPGPDSDITFTGPDSDHPPLHWA